MVEVVCGVQESIAFGGTRGDYGEAIGEGEATFGDFERSQVSEFSKITRSGLPSWAVTWAHERVLLRQIVRLHKSVSRFSAIGWIPGVRNLSARELGRSVPGTDTCGGRGRIRA